MPDPSELAKAIAKGTVDVRDTALGLSDGQIEILQALQHQLRNLEVIQAELRRFEAEQEALLPPVIPLDDFVAFQPDIAMPGGRTTATSARAGSPSHWSDVTTRRGAGLKPASSVLGPKLCSADEGVNGVVSVNALKPYRTDATKIAHYANYLAYHAANGALPVAIELSGDRDLNATDLSSTHRGILERRAQASALFVIDAKQLSNGDQRTIEAANGETGITGVSTAAIVCIIVSASCAGAMGSPRTVLVADKEGPVYSAAHKKAVTITHPDYEAGLTAVLTANPKRTIVTHVTRLGDGTKLT